MTADKKKGNKFVGEEQEGLAILKKLREGIHKKGSDNVSGNPVEKEENKSLRSKYKRNK